MPAAPATSRARSTSRTAASCATTGRSSSGPSSGMAFADAGIDVDAIDRPGGRLLQRRRLGDGGCERARGRRRAAPGRLRRLVERVGKPLGHAHRELGAVDGPRAPDRGHGARRRRLPVGPPHRPHPLDGEGAAHALLARGAGLGRRRDANGRPRRARDRDRRRLDRARRVGRGGAPPHPRPGRRRAGRAPAHRSAGRTRRGSGSRSAWSSSDGVRCPWRSRSASSAPARSRSSSCPAWWRRS